MIDRIETALRRLFRLPPEPSTDARVTPFVKQMRDVRREALQHERQRQRSWPEATIFPERNRHPERGGS